jgi:hypothetical protein
MSHDVLIEKIGANTELKLSFTSPSIEELALSFRTDGHQSNAMCICVLRTTETMQHALCDSFMQHWMNLWIWNSS